MENDDVQIHVEDVALRHVGAKQVKLVPPFNRLLEGRNWACPRTYVFRTICNTKVTYI